MYIRSVCNGTHACASRICERTQKCHLCTRRVHKVRCSQVIPNLLSCTIFRLKWGNGCSPLLQGCKTAGLYQWSKWKGAPEIYSTKDVAMNVSMYTSNHFRVKVYLLCWKSSKPHDIFMTFQNHPKTQAQEPCEGLKSSTVFSGLLANSSAYGQTHQPVWNEGKGELHLAGPNISTT